MGSFFTHVHVQAGRSSLEDVRAAAAAAVAAAGLVPANGPEDAERTVVIAPSGAGWMAIFDSETEGQDTNILEGLGRAISGALGVYAATSLVHDSDILDLCLFKNGARIDHLQVRGGSSKRAISRHIKAWKPVLPSGTSLEQLEAAFEVDGVLMESVAAEVGRVLGWDERLAAVGFDNLDELEPPALAGEVRLYFSRPGHAQRTHEGPPDLVLTAISGSGACGLGDAVQAGVTVANRGGESSGLMVELDGSAIERGLLSVSNLRVSCPKTARGRVQSEDHLTRSSTSFDPQPGGRLIAHLPDVVLRSAPLGLASSRAALDAHLDAAIYIAPDARAVALGAGELRLRIRPLAAPETGAVEHEIKISVQKAPRRPRTALSNVSSAVMRGLDQPLSLVAWVVLDGTQADLTPLVAEIFERWVATIGPIGDGSLETERWVVSRPRVHPKCKEIAPKSVPKGKAWATFRGALAEPGIVSARISPRMTRELILAYLSSRGLEHVVELMAKLSVGKDRAGSLSRDVPLDLHTLTGELAAHLGADPAQPFSMDRLGKSGSSADQAFFLALGELGSTFRAASLGGGHGMAFAAGDLPGVDAPQKPHLGLWLDLAGLDPETRARAEAKMVSLVDEAMQRGPGLQGMVAHWGTRLGPTTRFTDYELALELRHPLLATREWCTRQLRGVSERLWLGAELAGRVPRRSELEAVADVVESGGVWRITLRAGKSLDALEAALEPLLPSRARLDELMVRRV